MKRARTPAPPASSRSSFSATPTSLATLASVLVDARRIAPQGASKWRLADGLEHLARVDARFSSWIAQTGIPACYEAERPSNGHFPELVHAITSQQVSVAAGRSILARVMSALGAASKAELVPELVLRAKCGSVNVDGADKASINGVACGLSHAKLRYVRSLAEHCSDPKRLGVSAAALDAMDDAELVRRLVAVDGVGVWSAQMFLLFALRRPNVLALGDLGVRRGIAHLHGLSEDKWRRMREGDFAPLAEKWAPYSSLGCALMWQSGRVTIKPGVPTERATASEAPAQPKPAKRSRA